MKQLLVDRAIFGQSASRGEKGISIGAPLIKDMSEGRRHYAWIILIFGTTAILGLLGLGRFGYTMILPSMQAGLGLSNTQTGLLATANLLGYVFLSAIGGAMAAYYGPRKVITGGLILAGGGMLLTATATGFHEAALWRTLTGIGSGAGNVSVMGLMAAWFAARRRGMASGVAVSGSSMGLMVLGPSVPFILRVYGANGWRTCWIIFGGFTLFLAVMMFLILRDRPAEKGLQPYGSMQSAEPLPTAPSPSRNWSHVYRSARIWHLGLVYVAYGFSYIIYMTFFAKRLVAEAGYRPQEAGQLFMTMGALSLFCGFFWGWVSDRVGRRRALLMLYLVQAVSYAMFAFQSPLAPIISAILFGLTAWSIPAIMAAACGDLLGSRLAPAALGFITVFFGVGQALGPVVAGAMADVFSTFRPAFVLAALVSLAGAMGALSLPSDSIIHHRRESE